MLFSLGWWVLWLPLGILFALPSLLPYPKVLVFACLMYAIVLIWKLASASRLFRKMDKLTAWFGLLLSYAAAFVAFLLWLAYVRPPRATDLMVMPTLYIIGGTFVSMGFVMVVRPELAARNKRTGWRQDSCGSTACRTFCPHVDANWRSIPYDPGWAAVSGGDEGNLDGIGGIAILTACTRQEQSQSYSASVADYSGTGGLPFAKLNLGDYAVRTSPLARQTLRVLCSARHAARWRF